MRFALIKPSFCFLLLSLARLASGATVDYERDIQPLLSSRCYKCHGLEKQKSGLRLDQKASALQGGDSGQKAVVPSESAKSRLLTLVSSADPAERMPYKEDPLSPAQIQLLKTWIDTGLSWPDSNATADPARHWSFQPVRKPAVPTPRNSRWVGTPVDGFILSRLEAAGFSPAPEASRPALIRRLSFDLRGVPPSPSEVEAFVQDSSPRAYQQLVEKFLDSPEYGERWAQHWLDVVRYGESEGFEYDRDVPDAWRYRDYVIDSLNRDKPFDQFIREQIAGDELRPRDPEALAAAVFHRLAAVRRNAGNQEVAASRNEVLTERTDIIGSAFIGLTVGCARCHNHKFDPIPQKDYYRLQAYLAATQEHDAIQASPEAQAEWKSKTKVTTEKIASLKKEFKNAEGDRRMFLELEIRDLEKSLPPHLPTIPTVENGDRTEIHVLRRGDPEKPGDVVHPGPLSILAPEACQVDEHAPRTSLAQWLSDPKHPLVPRVIANRIWQNHFGQGLVKTPNDFGVNGDRPSHPELLDWLAAELVQSGWSWKHLHRVILLSSAYRQGFENSNATAAGRQDPDNRLLWHFNRRRLSAEELRDAMLSVSGALNPKRGGRGIITPVEKELVDLLYNPAQWTVDPDLAEHSRRSIYLIAKRNLRLPFMEVFDQPPLLSSCPRRESSTHAPQALEMLNGRLANTLAHTFAERLRREAPNPEAIVPRAYALALNRAPASTEQRAAAEFLRTEPLAEFALALFNLNDFLYVQ